MSLSDDLRPLLTALPLRIGLYVPSDLLEDEFDDRITPEAFARECDCEYEYYPERKEGVFWKWVPGI